MSPLPQALLVVLATWSSAPGRRISAERAGAAPQLDGLLDEPLWSQAEFSGEFRQLEPEPGMPARHPTEVAFAYDDEALYVAARMGSAGGPVRGVLGARDEVRATEYLVVYLDPERARRAAYAFGVTAAGQRLDWILPEDDRDRLDPSFDPGWTARAQLAADGWTAELRIPFSELRFSQSATAAWGLDVRRFSPDGHEDSYWTRRSPEDGGFVSRFGALTLDLSPPAAGLVLRPFLASDLTLTDRALVGPLTPAVRPGLRAGFDLEARLGPSRTLSAAVLPDFGQLEADPTRINLTAQELVLEERRPLFVEGAELFTGSFPAYFYSRRIGALPRGAEPDAAGRVVPILGAAKLALRPGEGQALGALFALSDQLELELESDAGEPSTVVVAPRSVYGVLGLTESFEDSGVVARVLLTSVGRQLSPPLRPLLARQAHTGGLHLFWRDAESSHELRAGLGGSLVEGAPAAILRLQRSPVHLFQRPDQGHVRLEEDRRILSGWTANLTAQRLDGWLRWRVDARADSPGLDLNDAGYLAVADDLLLRGELELRTVEPGAGYQELSLTAELAEDWSFGGLRRPLVGSLQASWVAPGFWSVLVYSALYAPGHDDSLTRGGPAVPTPLGAEAGLELAGPPADEYGWRVSAAFLAGDYAQDRGLKLEGHLDVRSGPLALSLSPRLWLLENPLQFVVTLEGGRPETFGQRHVLAHLDYVELALQLRARLQLSPQLSLELYAEPFLSRAGFDGFGELLRPGSRALLDYAGAGAFSRAEGTISALEGALALADPDFAGKSLRATFVARWEYAPDSELILVWQRSGEIYTAPARLEARDALASLAAPGAHVLALKLSYAWALR